jgi:hypothetical protein
MSWKFKVEWGRGCAVAQKSRKDFMVIKLEFDFEEGGKVK